MALILASALLTRLEQMTDTENDTHLGTAEKYAILTSAAAETWDKIIAAGLGGERVKSVNIAVTAGTSEYPIATAVSAGDFYKVSEVYISESNGHFRPIPRIPPGERHAWKAPNTSATIKLYYVPNAPVWTTGTETLDGINGWEEHTLVTAAITIKNKKQDDAGPYKQRKRELEERIATMGNRSMAEPPRVIRRGTSRREAMYSIPYFNGVGGWDVRGANFEFVYRDNHWF